MVGIPWDKTSSYRQGAAAGPNAIRRATNGKLYNRFTETGADLALLWRVCDHGNVKIAGRSVSDLERRIRSVVSLHNHQKAPMLFLGGDHFVTYPTFSVTAQTQGRPLSLLYFDAHPDLYDDYGGNLYSHATVVSRILDRKHTMSGSVCYVGIRASTEDQEEKMRRLGLTEFTARDVYLRGCEEISASIRSKLSNHATYVSIDLDCLDPAFAPGVGNPQPGGLTTRQLLDILHGIEGLEVVAADVVEYSPKYDTKARTTAFTSSILVKEMMGVMAKSG